MPRLTNEERARLLGMPESGLSQSHVARRFKVIRSMYFRLLPLKKRVRKVVGGFGKKSCVSTGVRKPGNTCASPTAMI